MTLKEKTEQKLRHTAMEHVAKESVPERYRSETVAMAKAEFLSSDLHKCRLGQLHQSQFLKIGICPYVVVTLEEINLYPSVHQFLQGSEHSYITFRHDIKILIPEVPDVTKQVYGLRVLRKTPEKISETAFTTCRIGDLKTKVDV